MVLQGVDRSYVGVGTVLYMALDGPIIDVYTFWLGPVMHPELPLPLRLGLLVAGHLILAFGMTIVIRSQAGTGPNDLVAVVLGDKSGKPFGLVRVCVDAAFAGIGFLLGGVLGVGTVVCVCLVGPAAQLFFPISKKFVRLHWRISGGSPPTEVNAMTIYSVFDPEFKPYGQIVTGMEEPAAELLTALQSTSQGAGVAYVPADPALQDLPAAAEISKHCFGGMPVQLGWCNGHNTKLNCLEYHRDSEFNLGTEDFILLLARQEEIENGLLETAKVKAFKVPAGVLVEVYATTLHYAPCHCDPAKGFRVLVALPWGTNTQRPAMEAKTPEDAFLTACNKWLLPHPDSDEARGGANVGLTGDNIDISNFL